MAQMKSIVVDRGDSVRASQFRKSFGLGLLICFTTPCDEDLLANCNLDRVLAIILGNRFLQEAVTVGRNMVDKDLLGVEGALSEVS